MVGIGVAPSEEAPTVTDLSAILPRLVETALVGRRDDELLGILCEDLLAHGMPLLRGSVSTEFLHPTLEFRVSRWVRGHGVESQTFNRRPLTSAAERVSTSRSWALPLTRRHGSPRYAVRSNRH